MKTIETTVYSPAELKEANPEAYEQALENWQNNQDGDIPWQDEICDSLKSMIKATDGISLRDWSLGMESYSSFVKIDWGFDWEIVPHPRTFTGQKAYNWLKANLLDGATFRRVTYDKRKGGKGWRYDLTKKDGTPWSCEFTGVCYDHDYLESVLDDIRSGCTLEEAYNNLAGECSRLLELEYEYATSEECFLEQPDYQLTFEGHVFRG